MVDRGKKIGKNLDEFGFDWADKAKINEIFGKILRILRLKPKICQDDRWTANDKRMDEDIWS